jgi:hypothetical protein
MTGEKVKAHFSSWAEDSKLLSGISAILEAWIFLD